MGTRVDNKVAAGGNFLGDGIFRILIMVVATQLPVFERTR